MAEPSPPARRVQPATIALCLAALLALAAGVYAVFIRGGESAETPTENAVEGAGTVEEMMARIAGRLQQNPDDAESWRMFGWANFELARQARSDAAFREAMTRAAGAYRRAAQLQPDNAENWSSLGEALQVATTQVSPEAERAFARALAINPADPRARYFAAVQKDMRGRHREAIDDWLALLADTPAGAPWEADLRRIITQTAERQRIDVAGRMPAARPAPAQATDAIPGPTPEQMAAASAMRPGEQDAAVRSMVERLAARLRQDPRDADGWIRLMRSRMVLNDPPAARQALASGLAAFQGDATTRARLRGAARELGVPQ
jgi:cytochrome c-type biogenesis protein CcmH